MQQLDRAPHLLALRMRGAPEARKRQERHPWLDFKSSRRLCGASSDLNEVLRGRLDVHTGVSQELDVAFLRNHRVAAGDFVQPLSHAHDL